MKKLLIALCMMFSFALTAPAAKANFYIDYPYGQFSEVYALGGNQLAFVFFCWSSDCAYWDVFTTHSSGAGSPINASLSGAPYGMGYFLEEDYYDAFYVYYYVYVTTNYGYPWNYVGYYYLPY